MNIIVTGSLGHISQSLATALERRDHAVTSIDCQPDTR